MKHIAFILPLTTLGACTQPHVILRTLCLPLPHYTQEFQKKTAEELQKHPELTHITQQIIDYNKMQIQITTCLKENLKKSSMFN